MKNRNRILYGALAVTLAATWWTARQEEAAPGIAEPVIRPDTPANLVASAGTGRVNAHTVMQEASADAFAPRDWAPPPPPPPKALPPPPPPPPVAPPLPYRYLGKWLEDGRLVVFLNTGNRSTRVKGGEVLDGQWRVDEITPKFVRFTYLPLTQTTTLSIGDAL